MNKDRLIENLKKNRFQVECFETGKEAVDYLSNALSEKTVGIGGSMTVKEMELDKALEKKNQIFWHWRPEQVERFGGAKKVRDQAQSAQVYISSANAISETGEIINIDGTGNRISSLSYGHESVYFIVGVNKVEENLERAMWRARNIAAPKNAMRLKRKTPCAVKGDRCYDCNSPERICNGFLVLAKPMSGMKMTVILVNEELGA